MTENDYIAEYIKERHPGFLGFDFFIWKLARKIVETGKAIAEVMENAFSDNQEETTESEETIDE